ncbi:MAG: ECF-type sigma factor [Planctomycetota bacterium]
MHDVTHLLNSDEITDDDRSRLLMEAVYFQLRRQANSLLQGERRDSTLSATVLVHESYLKLVGERHVPWANRAHFYVAAVEAMRRLIIDHARSRGRLKRGGDRVQFSFNDAFELAEQPPEDVERFNEALIKLEGRSPVAARVVQFRFFAGLTVEQTASALDLSGSTVDRKWSYARAWLYRELDGG